MSRKEFGNLSKELMLGICISEFFLISSFNMWSRAVTSFGMGTSEKLDVEFIDVVSREEVMPGVCVSCVLFFLQLLDNLEEDDVAAEPGGNS
jgi:hypothetical protein